jgi:hypothetical protein
VILAAGRATEQMRAHPGDGQIGRVACGRHIDVSVELREAFLASQLGLAGTQ